MIIRTLILILTLCVTSHASTLEALRSRLNHYLGDSANLMLPAYVKDSILNVAQSEYAASFPVHVDTSSQELTANTRIYTLPSDYAGRVISLHKNDANFTELPYVSTDSTPQLSEGVVEYYSIQHNMLIMYPNPPTNDTVFFFYASRPAALAAATECALLDHLEEPMVLLAVSKCWATKDLRLDLAEWWYARYEREAARLTRVELEQLQR